MSTQNAAPPTKYAAAQSVLVVSKGKRQRNASLCEKTSDESKQTFWWLPLPPRVAKVVTNHLACWSPSWRYRATLRAKHKPPSIGDWEGTRRLVSSLPWWLPKDRHLIVNTRLLQCGEGKLSTRSWIQSALSAQVNIRISLDLKLPTLNCILLLACPESIQAAASKKNILWWSIRWYQLTPFVPCIQGIVDLAACSSDSEHWT